MKFVTSVKVAVIAGRELAGLDSCLRLSGEVLLRLQRSEAACAVSAVVVLLDTPICRECAP